MTAGRRRDRGGDALRVAVLALLVLAPLLA
jgi:hypothetical protein